MAHLSEDRTSAKAQLFAALSAVYRSWGTGEMIQTYEALGPAIALAEHVPSLGAPDDATEKMVLEVHMRSVGFLLPYAREELVRVHRVALTLRERA